MDWDAKTRKKGVYRIVSDKHKGWSQFVDKELGNYDYLLGIDVRLSIDFGVAFNAYRSRRSTIATPKYAKTCWHGRPGCYR